MYDNILPLILASSDSSSPIQAAREWAMSHSYTLLSGTTDTGQYICYYDHIPFHPRDYYIDQYDYCTATTELDAVLRACEAIYSTTLDTP